MVWFGGISDHDETCSSSVYGVTLRLDFNADKSIKVGLLTLGKLQNKRGEDATLKCTDRFFYNQEFYLPEPTEQLTSMGLGYTGRYTNRFFNKNRYIGVIGRRAFHVFDLE